MKPSVRAVPETTKIKSGHGSSSEVCSCAVLHVLFAFMDSSV